LFVFEAALSNQYDKYMKNFQTEIKDVYQPFNGIDRQYFSTFSKLNDCEKDIIEVFLNSDYKYISTLLDNSTLDEFMKLKTLRGWQYNHSSRSQERPIIPDDEPAKSEYTTWRAISTWINEVVPGYNFHLLPLYWVFEELESKYPEGGKLPYWVHTISELMDKNTLFSDAIQYMAYSLQYKVVPISIKIWQLGIPSSELGDKFVNFMIEGYKYSRKMMRKIQEYRKSIGKPKDKLVYKIEDGKVNYNWLGLQLLCMESRKNWILTKDKKDKEYHSDVGLRIGTVYLLIMKSSGLFEAPI